MPRFRVQKSVSSLLISGKLIELMDIVVKFRRSFLLKPEITQKVKLVHSLNEQQDVLASKSSVPTPEQPSGLTKIASLFGNHRSRTSVVMLGLAISMGISSISANYSDAVAAAESIVNSIATGNRSIDLSIQSGNGYIKQLRNDVALMQARFAQPQVLVAQVTPRAYPAPVANRTDTNSLNFSGEASVSIEVAPPKTKTFKSVATATPYLNPNYTGSEGDLNTPEDRYPSKTGETTLAFSWPAAGTVTSRFGRRWGRMHKGIDIAGPVGTPINAAADGIVLVAGWKSGYGNLVEIRHGDGTITRYGHNSRLSVGVGQVVRQGQQVAQMGSTGHSTGSHLHFEIRPSGGSAVNPIALLPTNS
jgi:murein DD-endopeptidase MepM/ murein hydrolase activator NlpD